MRMMRSFQYVGSDAVHQDPELDVGIFVRARAGDSHALLKL